MESRKHGAVKHDALPEQKCLDSMVHASMKDPGPKKEIKVKANHPARYRQRSARRAESEGAWQNHGLHTDEAVEQVLEVGFSIRCLSIVHPIFFEAIATRSFFEAWAFKEVYIIDRQPTIRR